MKLAIFGIFMLVAVALATPVPDPVPDSVPGPETKPEEPKDLEGSQPGDDLKTDNTFGIGFYKPYYSHGWGYRPYYRTWGGYGGWGYGGWGGYDNYYRPHYSSYYW